MIALTKKLRWILLCICTVLLLLLLTACNRSQHENVDIQTTLSVDNSFSGKRTIVLTFPQSVISPGSETETSLEKVVQKHCPNTLTPSKGSADGKVQYSFEMSFESAHEYTEKTTDITGKQTVISFSNPNNVMTQGWKLEENFQSSELILDWIAKGAKQEGFSNLEFTTDKTLYDRTIIFTISQSTFDAMSKDIREYFKTITDKAALSAEWLLNTNNSYDYTVKFNDVTIQELSGYTNKLLNSVYGDIEYSDKASGSTVLAEQNSYSETLDFSNYIGNNGTNVPVEFTYSVSGNTELGECQLYEDGEWHIASDFLDTNQYGRRSAIRYLGSVMKMRINDGKQYTASSIEIETLPLEEDKLQKTITFRFDRTAGGDEASDYTRSYLSGLGYGAVQTVYNDECICTYTTSGTTDTLNDIFTHILGGKNIAKFTSEGQFMTLRTMKHYRDKLDLSAVILGKNAETPVYYRIAAQNGELIKAFDYKSSEQSETADLKDIKDGFLTLKLTGTDVDVSFDITTPNVSDIIFCSVISAIIVLIAAAAIFVLRKQKVPVTGLGSGVDHSGLPDSKKELTVKKKGSSILNKK